MATLHRIKFFVESDESVYLFSERSLLEKSIEVTYSKLPVSDKPFIQKQASGEFLIDKLGQKIAEVDTISDEQVIYKEWTHF